MTLTEELQSEVDRFQEILLTFTFHGQRIPEYMREDLVQYIVYGRPACSFVEQVVYNSLSGAVGAADDINIHLLPAYVAFFYNHAPSNCWGSQELYNDWIELRGLYNGRYEEADE